MMPHLVGARVQVGQRQDEQVVLQDVEGGGDRQRDCLSWLLHHLPGELAAHAQGPGLHAQECQAEEILPNFGEENHCCRNIQRTLAR